MGDAGDDVLPCRGCGGPVRVGADEPRGFELTRVGGRVVRRASVWCPACAAELDGRRRREFPNTFGGERP